MKLRSLACAAIGVGSITAAAAAGVDTTDPTVIAAFQSGLTVQTFESLAGRTPQAITAYTQGVPVSPNAFVFNQVPGVQFSVGGVVGTNMPALYQLGGAIAGNAHSGSTVLGPVDFDFTTKFGPGAFIEVFFPVKVSSVGFWLNPALGNVTLIAADTNFAFSGLPETTLETFAGRHRGPLRRHLAADGRHRRLQDHRHRHHGLDRGRLQLWRGGGDHAGARAGRMGTAARRCSRDGGVAPARKSAERVDAPFPFLPPLP